MDECMAMFDFNVGRPMPWFLWDDADAWHASVTKTACDLIHPRCSSFLDITDRVDPGYLEQLFSDKGVTKQFARILTGTDLEAIHVDEEAYWKAYWSRLEGSDVQADLDVASDSSQVISEPSGNGSDHGLPDDSTGFGGKARGSISLHS